MNLFSKILLFTFLILVLFTGLFLYGNYKFDYSDGERAGRVIKFSSKGFVFKTWEGQINMGGGYDSDGDVTASQWEFSVYDNPEVKEQLREAMAKGYRVRVHYKEKLFHVFFMGDTKYFIDEVTPVLESY